MAKKSLSKARRRYRRQVGLNRKHLKVNTRSRFSKLRISKGDIILIHPHEAAEIPDHVRKVLLDADASYILVLRQDETIETITPRLFQEAISKVVGEKARQAIMKYVTDTPQPKRENKSETHTNNGSSYEPMTVKAAYRALQSGKITTLEFEADLNRLIRES